MSRVAFENQWLRVALVDHLGKPYTTFSLPKAGGIVVPFTPDGRVILVEQFRVPLGIRTLEFPAGAFEKSDKNHASMMERELLEETGFQAGRMKLLGKLLIVPSFSDSLSHIFAAYDCSLAGAQNLDAGEAGLSVILMSKEEVETAIQKGRINAAEHVAAWHLAKP